MSDYKFKSFSEIDTVEAPSETATVVGIENGKPIQMPMKSMKAGEPIIINYEEWPFEDVEEGDKIKEGLLNGTPIWIYYPSFDAYGTILRFDLPTVTTDGYLMRIYLTWDTYDSGSAHALVLSTGSSNMTIKVSTNEV